MGAYIFLPILHVIALLNFVLAVPTPLTFSSADIKTTLQAIDAVHQTGDGGSTLSVIGRRDAFASFLAVIMGTEHGPAPRTVEDALSSLSTMNNGQPQTLYTTAAKMISSGLLAPGLDLQAVKDGITTTGRGSTTNNNPKNPSAPIFPQKEPTDAPYSLDEATLRGAIFIPPGFTYGAKPPTILTPGTGNVGFTTYSGNFMKTLTNVPFADPVWLNIPGCLIGDAQVNSEYVAYAINYISGIANRNVSVISWSQGGLNTQWALKYWLSTRRVTSNFIAISPDFKGTILSKVVCPGGLFNLLLCTPATDQQDVGSNFVATLRANGGDSAYVPTTTIYSATDEVVQPQFGDGASAFMKDAHAVGVSNSEMQVVCRGQTAGGFYTHEGVLYSSLAFELAKDALVHGGPGNVARIDMNAACSNAVAQGLEVGDVLQTESAVIVSAVLIITFPQKVYQEPAIMAYAAGG